MADHVEWMEAGHTAVKALENGRRVGVHKVTGAVAVVLSADQTVVIEGGPAQVRRVFTDALAALDALEARS